MSSVLQALSAQHGAVLTTSAKIEFPAEARVTGPGGQGFRGDGIQPTAHFRGFPANSSGQPFLIRFPPGHDDHETSCTIFSDQKVTGQRAVRGL